MLGGRSGGRKASERSPHAGVTTRARSSPLVLQTRPRGWLDPSDGALLRKAAIFDADWCAARGKGGRGAVKASAAKLTLRRGGSTGRRPSGKPAPRCRTRPRCRAARST